MSYRILTFCLVATFSIISSVHSPSATYGKPTIKNQQNSPQPKSKRSRAKKIATSKQRPRSYQNFRIQSIEGDASYWSPLSAKWRPIKKDLELPPDTIISINDTSKIKVKFWISSKRGWRGETARLNFQKAADFRLSHDLFRKLDNNEFHYSAIPKRPEEEQEESGKEWDALDHAWEKNTIFVRRTKTNQEYVDSLFKEAEEQLEIGIQNQKIEILYPKHSNAILIDENGVGEIPIVWTHETPYTDKYLVYLWKATDSKPEPFTSTKTQEYTIKNPQEGSYYVQIASTDFRLMSEPHLFHVTTRFGGQRVKTNDTYQTPDEMVTPLLPQDHMYIYTPAKSRKTRVQFSWQQNDFESVAKTWLVIQRKGDFWGIYDRAGGKKPPSEKTDANITVEELRKNTQKFRIDRIRSQTKNVSLEPGVYDWWISILIKQVKKNKNEPDDVIVERYEEIILNAERTPKIRFVLGDREQQGAPFSEFIQEVFFSTTDTGNIYLPYGL